MHQRIIQVRHRLTRWLAYWRASLVAQSVRHGAMRKANGYLQVINAKQNVVLQTESGYFLRFHGSEISEMKKTAVGVKGIKLQKKDYVEHVYLFEEGKESKVIYKDKEITLNRLKQSSRAATGNKQRG